MEFPDFSSDMLAVLNEDQRVIVLEEMHSLLGKGERYCRNCRSLESQGNAFRTEYTGVAASRKLVI